MRLVVLESPYADIIAFYTDYGMSNGMIRAQEFYNREGIAYEIRTIK